MKSFSIILMSLIICISCNQAPDADKAKVTEAKTEKAKEDVKPQIYKCDMLKTKVGFIGTKPVGSHEGYFTLKSGYLKTSQNKLKGGTFIIDVKSLVVTDLEGKGKEKLQGHLLSDDFLMADKHGTSQFAITNVAPLSTNADVKMEGANVSITGNLQLLDVNKSITFPAAVSIDDQQIVAKADFNIDRTQWGLAYGNDKSLGDKFIRPEVNIKLDILALRPSRSIK